MRLLSAAVLVVFASVAFASGPVVPGVDVTDPPRASSAGTIGSGTVSVGDATFSADTATLDRGEYGSGAYYLRAPSATIDVESASGRPIVGYRLRIPELGYTGSAIAFISADDIGPVTLELDRKPFSPERISDEAYRGEATLFVRANGEMRVLNETSIRIEVRP